MQNWRQFAKFTEPTSFARQRRLIAERHRCVNFLIKTITLNKFYIDLFEGQVELIPGEWEWSPANV